MHEKELDDDFNINVRKYVIFFILFVTLQFLSYIIISIYRKRLAVYCSDPEDVITYKVSFWTCNFSLSISIGFVLLLPMCILANEILLFYPDSYILWQNISFMQDFWDLSFLLSNLAIFILLPFAYFFSESQGFSGSYKGIKGRIYETCCVLILSMVLMISLIFTICSVFDYKNHFATVFKSWNDYFQFLYSFVRFLGVVMLVGCTPLGFTCLFTMVGNLVAKKQVVMDLKAEYLMRICERKHILEKLDGLEKDSLSNHQYAVVLKDDLQILNRTINRVESLLRSAKVRRVFIYPIAMTFLLCFTVRSIIMVIQNILSFVFGINSAQIYSQNFSLEIHSLPAFNSFLKIVLILYIWCSSVIGLYALPLFRQIKPKVHDTPMTHLIANCVLLLILSSTLPTVAKAAGATQFGLSEELK